ncbi:hypothetical protein ACV1D8_20305 [Aeromonas caviae]
MNNQSKKCLSEQHCLYPDLFQDLAPLATYQAFYQHYLPIRPQGTFMLGIKQDDAS